MAVFLYVETLDVEGNSLVRRRKGGQLVLFPMLLRILTIDNALGPSDLTEHSGERQGNFLSLLNLQTKLQYITG